MFDFGFTAVDEQELEAVQQAQSAADETSSTVAELECKIEELHQAILPLLNNLKQNPEKDYIYWPNRVGKVEQFEEHLLKIISK